MIHQSRAKPEQLGPTPLPPSQMWITSGHSTAGRRDFMERPRQGEARRYGLHLGWEQVPWWRELPLLYSYGAAVEVPSIAARLRGVRHVTVSCPPGPTHIVAPGDFSLEYPAGRKAITPGEGHLR